MTTRLPEPDDLNERGLRDRAVAAARGDLRFDYLITGGKILDVITGEIRAADIGLTGPMIASVHAAGSRNDAAAHIDASGRIITPGLIDTHMHVESSMVTPAAYCDATLPRGVTTLVWDPHEFGNVHGKIGVDWAVEATAHLDQRVIVLAPSCVPAAPGLERSGADFDGSAMASMLKHDAIGGIAEVMNMRGVIDRKPRITEVVQAGLASGKPVCGHARGLAGSDLAAFMAAGISSDHELTSADDFLEKLRAGLTIELRGSHDHLLPQIVAALNKLGHLPPTVTVCTDDIFPDELHNKGGLDDVVRRLVRYGMPASWAVRAATINAAIRLSRRDLGLIAAGNRADLVMFDDLEYFAADQVIANGQVVARGGQPLQPSITHKDDPLRNSVHCSVLCAADFQIASNAKRVRVATIDRPRFTRWGEVEAIVRDGHIVPPEHVTLMSVIHRHGHAEPKPQTGFLTGWGNWKGAFCTSVSHDSHNLTVFGNDPHDLAVATNAVIAMGGGMAVAKNGTITASMALPLSGLISPAPLAEISTDFSSIRTAMDQVIDWEPPYLIFKACFGATLACNAGPHQTDMGIADVTRDMPLENPILAEIE